jgi:hypothetical protein
VNNVYSAVVVPDNVPTVVNGITVPDRAPYSLKGLIIWCEADCVIEIKLNVDTIGGGRISGSVQTLFLDFSAAPFGLIHNDVVTVIATQADTLTPPASYEVRRTLLVEQL